VIGERHCRRAFGLGISPFEGPHNIALEPSHPPSVVPCRRGARLSAHVGQTKWSAETCQV